MSALEARIPVETGTRDTLRGLKQGAETYDDVINRLIEAYPAPE